MNKRVLKTCALCLVVSQLPEILAAQEPDGDSWFQIGEAYWETASRPVRVGIVTAANASQKSEIYSSVLNLDSLGIIDGTGLSRRASDSDVLVFIVDSWQALSDVPGFEQVAPPEPEFARLTERSSFFSYRVSFGGEQQLGILAFVGGESTDADCIASVTYASILSGFTVPAISYSDCM